jgi:membrane fusion protein (multidrug efflux system)
VRAGDVLAELDSSVEQTKIAEELTQQKGLLLRIDAVRHQIAAAQARRASQARLASITTKQAGTELEQAQVGAARQEELSGIVEGLHGEHLVSRVDAVNARAELLNSRLKIGGKQAEIERLHAARDYDNQAELAKVAELERELAELEAEQLLKQATIATARAQLARRKVLAPESGRLGNISALQVGDVVKAGDVIATVVPEDNVHVVAEFAPNDAVGRISKGQTARVRLDGFSWVEYGMLAAKVTEVANEPRDGTVRVELLLSANTTSVPLQHGLPGSVDVCIDRTSPLSLVLRSIGSVVTGSPAQGNAAALARTGGR